MTYRLPHYVFYNFQFSFEHTMFAFILQRSVVIHRQTNLTLLSYTGQTDITPAIKQGILI